MNIDNLSDEEARELYTKLNKRLKPEPYRLQNRPANEAMKNEQGQLLSIMGCDGSGGGVLEWCASEKEAEELLKAMQKDPRFSELSIEWFG